MSFSFSKEPTIWLGVLRAGLYLATTLGLSLDAAQTAAVVLFFEALTVAINRQVVSPVAKPKDPPSDTPPADDPAPPTPRTGSVPPNEAAMAGLFAAFVFVACASVPEKPPCDPATAAKLTAEAALAGEHCASQGIPEEECSDLADVNRRADERQAACAKRIQED